VRHTIFRRPGTAVYWIAPDRFSPLYTRLRRMWDAVRYRQPSPWRATMETLDASLWR
jgi:hypothetical protein